jgi:hypothetical protein
MEERGAVKMHLHGRLNLPSVMVVLWVFRRATKRQDRDRPEIVSLNAKSKPVLDRAKQLAGDGREDAEAVAELRALAGGKRRTLRQAEQASRFGGYHHELRRANLAHRLLQAAATGTQISAISSVDRERIEAVEAFKALPRDERWPRLAAMEPGLRALEAEVEEGSLTGIRDLPASVVLLQERRAAASQAGLAEVHISSDDRSPPSEQEMSEIRDYGRLQEDLMKRLAPLVGPDSPHDDLVLGSQSALDLASGHLMNPAAQSHAS